MLLPDPLKPEIEETFTTTPEPLARSIGAKARITEKGPRTLLMNMESMSSSVSPSRSACFTGTVNPAEGELCVTGPQMFAGYLDPGDDANRFLHHDGRRWYRTGDRVRFDGDGVLKYLGRLDHQVKVGGFRVELAEIEQAARALPGVHQAVAVPVSARDVTELALFYTGERDLDGVEASLALARSLPDYMLPRWFWRLDELPLNANRKVDRPALADVAATRVSARTPR